MKKVEILYECAGQKVCGWYLKDWVPPVQYDFDEVSEACKARKGGSVKLSDSTRRRKASEYKQLIELGHPVETLLNGKLMEMVNSSTTRKNKLCTYRMIFGDWEKQGFISKNLSKMLDESYTESLAASDNHYIDRVVDFGFTMKDWIEAEPPIVGYTPFKIRRAEERHVVWALYAYIPPLRVSEYLNMMVTETMDDANDPDCNYFVKESDRFVINNQKATNAANPEKGRTIDLKHPLINPKILPILHARPIGKLLSFNTDSTMKTICQEILPNAKAQDLRQVYIGETFSKMSRRELIDCSYIMNHSPGTHVSAYGVGRESKMAEYLDQFINEFEAE